MAKLHSEIEKENEAKRLFVADMESFKKRFTSLEA